jgi:hypothetical protein
MHARSYASPIAVAGRARHHRVVSSRPRIALLVAVALTVAGCGGGGSPSKDTASGTTTQPAAASTAQATAPSQVPKSGPLPPSTKGPAARAAQTRVIRGWVDAARRGHSDKAALFFDLPALVQNGDAPLLLSKRQQVTAFTAALPCGAILVRAVQAPRGYVIGTFRLTNRPGSRCDTAVGTYAATAFRFNKGLIKTWIRVDEKSTPTESVAPPGKRAAPSPSTPTTPSPSNGPVV